MNNQIQRSLKMVLIILLVGAFSPPVLFASSQCEISDENPANEGFSAARLERMDMAMQEEIDGNKKAGIIVLIARHGKIVYHKAFGMANIEAGKPMQPDSLVRMYSMTKPITSVALLSLYEQGKFQLTDTLEQYIPEMEGLQVFTGVDDDGNLLTEHPKRKPTILDVFRHTAGFSYGMGESPVDNAYKKVGIDFATLNSLQELAVEKLPKVPLLFHPGERWKYSVAHDVQAYLVEYFSGMPFDEYLKKTIFEPLGMTDTFFGVPEEYVSRYTANYGPGENGGLKLIENQDGTDSESEFGGYARYTDIPFGGLGLSSTAMDYAKFSQMLVNGGELNGARILGKKTVELMTMNHLPSDKVIAPGIGYGLGVSSLLQPAGNLGSKGNFGWGGAATTSVIMDPEEYMVAILLTQYMPLDIGFISKWQTLVYQSVVE